MSSIYVLEPATHGKVLLKTEIGDVEMELWSKETPKACRNFIQLCLEGYYDGCVFHRVVPNFIAQTGDPTGSGEGGESIYGPEGFKTEIHSRLHFNRRGMVAMACDSSKLNQSQFFFTLDRCDQLDKQHTIFGKVVGETLFNLLKLNDFVLGPDDRPQYPPKILSTEVISNPFDDIEPRRKRKADVADLAGAPPAKRARTNARKDLSLLSFGEEEESLEHEEKKASFRPVSSVSSTSSSSSSSTPVSSADVSSSKKAAEPQRKVTVRVGRKPDPVKESDSDSDEDSEDEKRDKSGYDISFDRQMKERLMKQHSIKAPPPPSSSSESQKVAEAPKKPEAPAPKPKKTVSLLAQEKEKYLKKKRGLTKEEREEKTLSRLQMFQTALRSAVADDGVDDQKTSDIVGTDLHGLVPQDGGDDSGWKTHKLKFVNTGVKNFVNDDDQYITIDPLAKNPKKPLSRGPDHPSSRSRSSSSSSSSSSHSSSYSSSHRRAPRS